MKSSRYSQLKSLINFRPIVITSIVVLLSIIVVIGAPISKPESEFKLTTVFLVRHAEKAATPPEDPPLLDTGNARAKELVHILGNAGIKTIYTSQYLRTKQTGEPLAKHLGIETTTIEIKGNPQDSFNEVAEKIYQKQGETVLIVGHSNTVPLIIKTLGGDTVPTIADTEHDNLFVVTVYGKGKAKVTTLKYGK